MDNLDPYESAEAVCPNPTEDQFRVLVAETRTLIEEVITKNPKMTRAEAVSYAIDGIAEGWELSAQAEASLRDHYEVVS
jgi:hypothetical protein